MKTKIIMIGIIGLLLGYCVGYAVGYGMALNWAVDKGIYLLHIKGYDIELDAATIAQGLWQYKNHVNSYLPTNENLSS